MKLYGFEVNDLNEKVYYGREHVFTTDIGDTSENEELYWVVQVYEDTKTIVLDEVNLRNVSDEEINKALKIVSLEYNREKNVIQLIGSEDKIAESDSETVKFVIAETLGIHGPSNEIERFQYSDTEELNRILRQNYNIPHQF